MAYTFTFEKTFETTFTRTSARQIASKIVADLRRMHAYYGAPSEKEILDYFEEVTELLAEGYLASVEYGFRRQDTRVVSLMYTVSATGSLSDNRAGGVYAYADITGASWFSFLNYSQKWSTTLTPDQREKFSAKLPVKRSVGVEPQDGQGYWLDDRSYSADGVAARRRTFRPLN